MLNIFDYVDVAIRDEVAAEDELSEAIEKTRHARITREREKEYHEFEIWPLM